MVSPDEPPSSLPPQCTYEGHPLKVVQQSRNVGIMVSTTRGIGAACSHLRDKMLGAWTSVLRRYRSLQLVSCCCCFLRVSFQPGLTGVKYEGCVHFSR